MAYPIYDDPVVAEIHAVRAQMLAQYGADHRALMAQVRQRQALSDRVILAAPQLPHNMTSGLSKAGDHAVSER